MYCLAVTLFLSEIEYFIKGAIFINAKSEEL